MTALACFKPFEKLFDPRQKWKVTYTLFEIVIVTIAAMLSGAENYKQIADFARVKIKWLNKFGLLESGAPVERRVY